MCLIIYKPAGVKNPAEKILRKAIESNKNGFGVMQRVGDNIKITKGLFDINTVIKMVNLVPKHIEAAYHFRLATHGTISAANCHPFPLTHHNDALRAISGTFDTGLVHNGVIHDFGRGGLKQEIDSLSDTMNFVKHLTKITKQRYTFDRLRKHIPDRYGKFIIFTPTYTFYFGTFYEDQGLRYSNTSYKDFNDVWGYNKGTNYSNALDEDKVNLPVKNQLTNTQIGKLVDHLTKKEKTDETKRVKHKFPLVTEVEPQFIRYTDPMNPHSGEVEYLQMYGTLIVYKGRHLFVECGATKDDVLTAALMIEEDLEEDGLEHRESEVKANLERLNLFP